MGTLKRKKINTLLCNVDFDGYSLKDMIEEIDILVMSYGEEAFFEANYECESSSFELRIEKLESDKAFKARQKSHDRFLAAESEREKLKEAHERRMLAELKLKYED